MATNKETVDYLLECIKHISSIHTRKMFGEYALYYQNKVVAFICDDQLFMKITPITDNFIDESYNSPPYPGAKPYRVIPEDKWSDNEFMKNLIKQTAEYIAEKKNK